MDNSTKVFAEKEWQKCKSFLKQNIEKPTFEMCIKNIQPIALEANMLTLSISTFAFNLLKKKNGLIEMIEKSVKTYFSPECKVEFLLTEEQSSADTNADSEKNEDQISENKELPQEKIPELGINPKNTFDTFVRGDSNDLAFSASVAVANKPGKSYNPLFIYGGVGLGKTHLLQAIAHTVIKNNPKSKIAYISTERFATEMIRHLQENKIVKFKEKYRNVDVLLIDDIQFLIGKEGTQDEFFHTFNELHSAGKQIVISSDRLPKEIPNIHDRLRSRFEWGLTVDIQQPDIETRQAILGKKAEMEKINIPDDVKSYIAEIINTNIRELEGALIKVIATASLLNKKIDIELAKFALKDIVPEKSAEITPNIIQNCVSEYFGIKTSDILSSKRDQKYSYPRHIAMYITREMTNMSFLDIAKSLGKNDHTTIKHGCDKISALIENPSDRTKSNIENIKNNIKDKIKGR